MDEDYPKTLMEMERRFATEGACREYLTQLRQLPPAQYLKELTCRYRSGFVRRGWLRARSPAAVHWAYSAF